MHARRWMGPAKPERKKETMADIQIRKGMCISITVPGRGTQTGTVVSVDSQFNVALGRYEYAVELDTGRGKVITWKEWYDGGTWRHA